MPKQDSQISKYISKFIFKIMTEKKIPKIILIDDVLLKD